MGSVPRTCDVAVVGGGIVGLATALALLERKAGRVLVLEAEEKPALHQSGRNSGIIHSGLYYAPGSAKARLCAEGREDLYDFCREHGLPVRRTGKLVVASGEDDLPVLRRLAQRGRANGLEGLSLLDPEEVRELEPRVAALGALHVQETGIVDFGEVTRAMGRQVSEHPQGVVELGCRVLSARVGRESVRIRTSRGEVEVGSLVNCAGLQADRVARRCGIRPALRIIPFRGDYFEVLSHRGNLVSRPVYPVPDPDFPFLGVHLHPTVDGRLEAGPNAVLALARNGYSPLSVNLRDTLQILGFSGFWKLAGRHWRQAAGEMLRAASRRRFAHAVGRLVPGVEPTDLRRSRSGLRAQAVDPDGRLLDDFHFESGERMLHVLNSPSPGATASMAIGRHVAERLLCGILS